MNNKNETKNIFSDVDQRSRKMMADVFFSALDYPTISEAKLKLKYPYLVDQTIQELLVAMLNLQLISSLPSGEYQVNPRSLDDIIPPVLWLMMNDGRYKKEEIEKKVLALPKIDKKRISSILSKEDGFKWIHINDTKPPLNTPVVFRFYDPNKSYGESFTEILEAEDMKVGTFDGKDWKILPPFPLYDSSPLSDKDKLNDGAIVTHWAEVDEVTMEGWNTRFDPMGTYKHLNIEVDKEHEKELYRALLWASSFIRSNMESNNNPESNKELFSFYRILVDLQWCMDNGKALENYSEEGNEPPTNSNVIKGNFGKEE